MRRVSYYLGARDKAEDKDEEPETAKSEDLTPRIKARPGARPPVPNPSAYRPRPHDAPPAVTPASPMKPRPGSTRP